MNYCVLHHTCNVYLSVRSSAQWRMLQSHLHIWVFCQSKTVQDFGLRITFKHHCIYTQTLYASIFGHAVTIVLSFSTPSDVRSPSWGSLWGDPPTSSQSVSTQHQCDTGETEQPVHHTSTMERALLQVRGTVIHNTLWQKCISRGSVYAGKFFIFNTRIR